MKKRIKQIVALGFLGGILITSTIVIAIPGLAPTEFDGPESMKLADYDYSTNYEEGERARFCGSGQPPGSTDYVREFLIPTACSNPLAVAVDFDGIPWFVETNTGAVAKFDPATETFTEYPNPSWPVGARSMTWGADHAANGALWYTDEWSNSLWAFNTLNGMHGHIEYPGGEVDALPQRLVVDGSRIIVNDFTGNVLTFLDSANPDAFTVAPSPIDMAHTSGFAPDDEGYIWYTSWAFMQGPGFLVNFDYERYMDAATTLDQMSPPIMDYVKLYELPSHLLTPNGVTVSDTGTIWLADTSSSSVYEFNPQLGMFVQYVTADPMPSTYGNDTGVIKSPISRPYWIDTDDNGRIVFNSQTSNNISIIDPFMQKIVEYHVPSKNPLWTDCSVLDGPDAGNSTVQKEAGMDRCGIAQIFDFDIHGDKIWFTEWAENKIGVVDTSVPLPFDVEALQDSFVASPGGSLEAGFTVVTSGDPGLPDPFALPAGPYIVVSKTAPVADYSPRTYGATITVLDDAPPGLYKVLLGAQSPDVAVGQFVTVVVQ